MIPIKHGEGNWAADDRLYADVVEGVARSFFATRRTSTAPATRVAGIADEDGNVLGLIPHPEHAVDPLLGPTGGAPLLEGLIAAARGRVADYALGGR